MYHTVFVVFSTANQKPVLTTPYLTKAKEYVQDRLGSEWAFGEGRYYCPYVIFDCYVTTGDEEDDEA